MPKDTRGFPGYYLHMRVLRVVALWALPALALTVVLVAVGLLTVFGVISRVWVAVSLPVAIAVHLLGDRYLNEADNRVYSWFVGRNAEWDVSDALSTHLDDPLLSAQ